MVLFADDGHLVPQHGLEIPSDVRLQAPFQNLGHALAREINDRLAHLVTGAHRRHRQAVDRGHRKLHRGLAAAAIGFPGHDRGLQVVHGERGPAVVRLSLGAVRQRPSGAPGQVERAE